MQKQMEAEILGRLQKFLKNSDRESIHYQGYLTLLLKLGSSAYLRLWRVSVAALHFDWLIGRLS